MKHGRLSVRLDGETLRRLDSLADSYSIAGGRPTVSAVVRLAIDRLWEDTHGASGRGARGSVTPVSGVAEERQVTAVTRSGPAKRERAVPGSNR